MTFAFLKFAETLHRISITICHACLGVLLVSMTAGVLLRYGVGIGFLKLQDLTLYAFSIFAMLGIPCAIATARHVRVDMTGNVDSPHESGRIVRALTLVLLMAVSLMLLIHGWPFFTASLAMGEASGQIGGLAGLFMIKAFVPFGALLILIQGIALFLRKGETAN